MIFSRLEAMEWHHQYLAGGLADQNPMLLRYFDILHQEKARYQKEKQDENEKRMKARQSKSRMRSAGSRRRR